MKHLTISLLLTALCFITISSCGGDKSANAGIDNSDKSTSISDDQLSKEEVLARMNNANRDRSIIDQSAEKMVADKKTQGGKIGADQAEQSARNQRQRYEKVKDLPPTKEQKMVADNICTCLSNNPIFKSIKKAKSSNEIVEKVGDDKDKEIKALQDCYNNAMVPAVNSLGQDAGIFAMKSRVHLNKKCLDGTDKFWITVGAYLTRKAEDADIEIDMPKLEGGLLKKN